MNTDWKVETGTIEHLAEPKFTAEWETDEAGEIHIHSPELPGLERLLREAERAIDRWIVERL